MRRLRDIPLGGWLGIFMASGVLYVIIKSIVENGLGTAMKFLVLSVLFLLLVMGIYWLVDRQR